MVIAYVRHIGIYMQEHTVLILLFQVHLIGLIGITLYFSDIIKLESSYWSNLIKIAIRSEESSFSTNIRLCIFFINPFTNKVIKLLYLKKFSCNLYVSYM